MFSAAHVALAVLSLVIAAHLRPGPQEVARLGIPDFRQRFEKTQVVASEGMRAFERSDERVRHVLLADEE
jgi:hypothetical protein